MRTSTIGSIAVCIAAILAAVSILALPRWTAQVRHQSAAKLAQELKSLPDLQAARLLATLREHDEDGLNALVSALADARPAVSHAAAIEIQRAIDSWHSLPAEVASSRVSLLADALEKQASALPSSRHFAARRIAQQLLLWPLDPAVDAGELIADCETVLRTCKAMPPQEAHPPQKDDARQHQVAAALPSALPLPPPAPLASPPAGDERLPTRIQDGNVPQRFFEPPPVAAIEPKRFLAPRLSRSALPEGTTAVAPEPPEQSPAAEPDRTDSMHRLSDVEVMRHLHSNDPAQVADSKAELAARGYEARHLPLATALVHPDAARRRRLAETLPLLKGIDPRPWLLQLQTDPDPEVRSAAKSILQTSRQPAQMAR